MSPIDHIRLFLLESRIHAEVLRELESYSGRELNSDLRVSPGDVPGLAREETRRRMREHRREIARGSDNRGFGFGHVRA